MQPPKKSSAKDLQPGIGTLSHGLWAGQPGFTLLREEDMDSWKTILFPSFKRYIYIGFHAFPYQFVDLTNCKVKHNIT